MPEMKRRHFLGLSAAVAVVAAVPVLSGDAIGDDSRPKIGGQFMTQTWVYAGSKEDAWINVFECETEMRRIEKTRRVILGRHTSCVTSYPDGVFCCTRVATVVGYA